MSELQTFHDELMADVIAEAAGTGGDGTRANTAFKEIAFTRIMLEDLEAAGVLESPVPCYFANTTTRLPYKVNALLSAGRGSSALDIVIADFRPESSGAEAHRGGYRPFVQAGAAVPVDCRGAGRAGGGLGATKSTRCCARSSRRSWTSIVSS